jgi:hypothetical protein
MNMNRKRMARFRKAIEKVGENEVLGIVVRKLPIEEANEVVSDLQSLDQFKSYGMYGEDTVTVATTFMPVSIDVLKFAAFLYDQESCPDRASQPIQDKLMMATVAASIASWCPEDDE